MSNNRMYLEYVRKVKLFNGLTTDEVAHILAQGTTMDFRAGETIFHKGQLGSNLFIVLQGNVNLMVGQRRIARCKPGDAFGEMSVLNHRPHTASAEAVTSVKVFLLSEQQLNRILQQGVAVRLLLNVVHMLSAYLETANQINTQNDLLIRRLTQSVESTVAV